MPTISNTEQTALNAGTVWWDGDLFSGAPNFKKLLSMPKPTLTTEEQAFLDGPVEVACRMTDDWNVSVSQDLPAEVWSYLKENGFLAEI